MGRRGTWDHAKKNIVAVIKQFFVADTHNCMYLYWLHEEMRVFSDHARCLHISS